MKKNMDEIMGTMPDFLRRRFEEITNAPPSEQPMVGAGNGGRLAAVADDADEWEVISAEPLPAATKVEPSIWAARGSELSIWRVEDDIEVVLTDFHGQRHYGRLTTPLLAEGGFGTSADAADKAFKARVFNAVVGPARDEEAAREAEGKPAVRYDDPNYRFRATCLWTKRDRTGAPHAHAFLVVTWKGWGSAAYPVHALLLNGDGMRAFDIERQNVTNPRQPQWRGRAQ